MRRLTAAVAALAGIVLAAGACEPDRADHPGPAYLHDVTARRAALEASLTGVENEYATLRRAHYATGGEGDWERLPAWNPRVQLVTDAGVVRGDGQWEDAGEALAIPPAAVAGDDSGLRQLGEAAFFRYPAQLLPTGVVLKDADRTRLGVWVDGARGVGGLVRVEVAGGDARLALTCASCHAAPRDGTLVPGLGNAAFDLGTWLAETAERAGTQADTSALRAWGAGRVDVSTASGRLPVRLPDLRPTRWLTHLHYEADVQQQTVASLAIRIETLLITSQGQAVRPPREVALALAVYLWSLADTLPAGGLETQTATAGPAAFRVHCGSCHRGPGLTGPPVDAALAGTDPTAALAPERGTGRYRPPSLRGLSQRQGLQHDALMHDGSIPSLDRLLDPGRLGTSGTAGHPFGLDLDAQTRSQLRAYLGAL